MLTFWQQLVFSQCSEQDFYLRSHTTFEAIWQLMMMINDDRLISIDCCKYNTSFLTYNTRSCFTLKWHSMLINHRVYSLFSYESYECNMEMWKRQRISYKLTFFINPKDNFPSSSWALISHSFSENIAIVFHMMTLQWCVRIKWDSSIYYWLFFHSSKDFLYMRIFSLLHLWLTTLPFFSRYYFRITCWIDVSINS